MKRYVNDNDKKIVSVLRLRKVKKFIKIMNINSKRILNELIPMLSNINTGIAYNLFEEQSYGLTLKYNEKIQPVENGYIDVDFKDGKTIITSLFIIDEYWNSLFYYTNDIPNNPTGMISDGDYYKKCFKKSMKKVLSFVLDLKKDDETFISVNRIMDDKEDIKNGRQNIIDEILKNGYLHRSNKFEIKFIKEV